jgi:hypothetical protein
LLATRGRFFSREDFVQRFALGRFALHLAASLWGRIVATPEALRLTLHFFPQEGQPIHPRTFSALEMDTGPASLQSRFCVIVCCDPLFYFIRFCLSLYSFILS